MSLFVFLIIMLSLSNTFTQSFSGYRNARVVQKDVENAQFALNLMAKELRTSTIVSFTVSSVKFYDYSQKKCFKYEIVGKELKVAQTGTVNPADYLDDPDDPSSFNPFSACALVDFSSSKALVKIENDSGDLTGTFQVVPSDKNSNPKKIGKITASLQISEGPKHTANVQTTSSLRDFGYVEVGP